MYAKKRQSALLCIIVTLLIIHANMLFAESFRVNKAVELAVSSSGEKHSVTVGINDCILITLPKDLTFVEGVELSFKVPQEVAAWRDCVMWSLYEDVFPRPTASAIDYSGTRGPSGTFGSSLRLTMQIPLTAQNTIKRNAYSQYIDTVADAKGGVILLRLQIAMKGTSDDVFSAQFEVTSRPLLINKGRLKIEAEGPGGSNVAPYTVFIDGKASDTKNGIFLSPGMHDVSFVSDFYRNEMRTVAIEQAHDSTLSVTFRDIAPTIRMLAPEGTKIYLDDALVSAALPVTVQQGEHQVRFVIGDYETMRSVTVLNGRSYTVSVAVDTSITEDE